MKKSISQFKRDIEGKTLDCVYHFKGEDNLGDRKVLKVQTKSIQFERNGKSLWLDIPKATNIDYIRNEVSIFSINGKREMTNDEQATYDEIKKKSNDYGNEKMGDMTIAEIDIMTDMNRCYYHDKALWENSAFPKLKEKLVHEKDNKVLVRDDSIRGELEMKYVIKDNEQ